MTLLNVSSSFESGLYCFIPVVLGLTMIVCVCNIAICRNFQHESVASQHRNGASRNRRLTKTLLLVSILALVCWLPIVILNILINITKTSIPLKFYYMVNILNYSNSFVNPIVYVCIQNSWVSASAAFLLYEEETSHYDGKNRKTNRKVAPRTPEIELRILRNDPQSPASWSWSRRYVETNF